MDVKECQSLDEVRKEIDKIDEEIVRLIAKRSKYVKQAAKFKESIEDIKSEERINDVLSHVRHLAATLGISPNLVADIFKILIDKMVEMEIEEFKNGGAY
ncbi:chorismate mutase [Nitratiruptor sp. YY09-18]|uniref:chorismate mutase n=1 Tax=Nitratiruptor sp. YY09-18 TaxID=2724901 RepID=UPI0019165490|nr:chorismate mutase [Nitratiruptor sp. YY09-18]BCD68098.1 isochorismate pyruvate lyase [Nitratiruptor sp. YY09-18]